MDLYRAKRSKVTGGFQMLKSPMGNDELCTPNPRTINGETDAHMDGPSPNPAPTSKAR